MGTNLWNRWVPWRHEKEADLSPDRVEFVPKLRINRSDTWAALELVLENHSDRTVWVEDATIVLTDLEENLQTVIPPGQVTHRIRQNIRANDTLSLSVAEPIYDAAGRPQGLYSSLVLTNVCYRVFSDWRSVQLKTCHVEMAALTPVNLHQARWYDKKMKHINRRVDITANQHRV